MSEDYFDVAWINYDKAILWGTRADQTEVDRDLTDEERDRVNRFISRHAAALQKLLRELAA